MRFHVGQIVLDRARLVSKAAAIVVDNTEHPKIRICRWRGGQQHWSLPTSVDADQLEPIADWTLIPLTEAKRLAAAAYERSYLVRAMESAGGVLANAARLAGVDRSNFRRLLQRHGIVKSPSPLRRAQRPARPARRKKRSRR